MCNVQCGGGSGFSGECTQFVARLFAQRAAVSRLSFFFVSDARAQTPCAAVAADGRLKATNERWLRWPVNTHGPKGALYGRILGAIATWSSLDGHKFVSLAIKVLVRPPLE